MKLSRPQTLLIVFAALLAPPRAAAQEADRAGWNDPVALELVTRSIERRSSEVSDTALQTYNARGNGYVYFLLDAPEVDRQALVRTDQVAVDVHWRAPNEVRQHIVGLREQRELPVTGLYYYLDRLTVVQDNYGQAIVIADGDNVRDVPHPVGLGAADVYEYRLGELVTMRLTGVPEPVNVRQLEVRPKDPTRPAVIGSIYLDTTTGALVRLVFTFTPSSYVDPRLDYINVTLENGLWRGRYWLPAEQRLEIRREMPELDLPFGTVIRTRMRIGEYRFNEGVPEALFARRATVTMAPRPQREQFVFEQTIDAEWRFEGFGRPPEIGEIRGQARAALREQVLSGLPRNRLSLDAASDVFRFNRAEGVAIGGGVSTSLLGERARLYGGWAFGADHPLAEVEVAATRRMSLTLDGYINRRRDIGGARATAGVTNTLAGLLFAQDWTDPFYASGVELRFADVPAPSWSMSAAVRAELQRSATLTSRLSVFNEGREWRPVHPIDRGSHLSGRVGAAYDGRTTAAGFWGEVGLTGGMLADTADGFGFGKVELAGGWLASRSGGRARLEIEGRGGMAIGGIPVQELWLLGGRGTLPGYAHRSFGGDRYARVEAVASADLSHPWARVRLIGAAGWADSADSRAASFLEVPGTGAVLPALGVGLGVFYDLVRADVVRGLGSDGRTQLILEATSRFWDWL